MGNHDDGAHELRQVVRASMQVSEAMVAVAFSAGDSREINARTETISAASEEMLASIQEVSRVGQESAAMAAECEQASKKSALAVARAVSGMQSIAQSCDTCTTRTGELEAASEKIGDILGVIHKIAGQTNLLALNATIEAARAGEAGRGFAVVASEVKELSRQTATATETIRTQVEALRRSIADIAQAIRGMGVSVEGGRAAMGEVGHEMHVIVEGMHGLTSGVASVASSVGEQGAAMKEINERVHEIAALARESVQHSEKATRAVSGNQTRIDEELAKLERADHPSFTLYRSQVDHFLWKKKLAEYLLGANQDFLGQLRDHHQCRLGKWYDRIAGDEPYRSIPEFVRLETVHAEVHRHGLRAAELFQAGDRRGAFEEFGKVDAASVEVVRLLDALARALGFAKAEE
ncbi:hypothetical protein ASA1KI_43910 [Opitutales bacterium ASA1]|uniref:methyl-accepting chemotaxis protein n=1 Tax=Congregicoccus parvus TaxID=3081749 RepID=UPI002B29ABED|nr:hypothetical protein ASA1KI_43910 [Opitutales bacterium ASA1]